MTPTGDALRAGVAEQLIALSADGGPLNTQSPSSTANRYRYDARRARVRNDIVDRFLASCPPGGEGRLAIITAGPPGAGKSTTLAAVIANLADFRILDADIVKDHLIEQALHDGIYGTLLATTLPDGHPIAPRELAPLVHVESVQLITRIRDICLEHGENVVVEATLQWDGHGPEIFDALAVADYASVEILAVEPERAIAHDQALHRWWEGRTRWATGENWRHGGRFVPPAAIDSCYPRIGGSICAEHARALIDRAHDGEIPTVRLRIFHRGAKPGEVHTTFDQTVVS